MNKILKSKTTTVITELKTIKLDNGLEADYKFINGKFTFSQNFYFRAKDKNDVRKEKFFYYLTDKTIEKLGNTHWSEHHSIDRANINIDSEEKLLNISKFDNFLYVGGGMDGMLRDINWTPISSIVRFDSGYMSFYQKLTNHTLVNNFLSRCNKKFIIKSELVKEYDYEDCVFRDTVIMDVKIPQDAYVQCVGKKAHIDEQVKQKIIDFIQK